MPKLSRKRPHNRCSVDDGLIAYNDSDAENIQELSSGDEIDHEIEKKSHLSSEEGEQSSDEDNDDSSWKGKCIEKWSLAVSSNDNTSEDSWQEYYEDREQYRYRDYCPDSEGDGSDEEEEYYDTAGQWGDDMCHYGCYLRRGFDSARQSIDKLVPGLGDSLCILTKSCQDEGNGPESPRDIEVETKLYSPYFSKFVKFDLSYHHRCRAFSVESMSRLDAYLFDEPNEINPRKIKVFHCNYNNTKHRQIRSKLGLPNLKAIQTHLFGSVPTYKRLSAAKKEKLANDTNKNKKSKQEKNANPRPPCAGEMLLPRHMFNLILAASLFEHECDQTDASRILHWVARDGNKAFYADSEIEEESDTNSNKSYYSEKEEEDEYDSDDGFRRSGSRDDCCIS